MSGSIRVVRARLTFDLSNMSDSPRALMLDRFVVYDLLACITMTTTKADTRSLSDLTEIHRKSVLVYHHGDVPDP